MDDNDGFIENLAEEYMDAEGLDYDSAYEVAEEDCLLSEL